MQVKEINIATILGVNVCAFVPLYVECVYQKTKMPALPNCLFIYSRLRLHGFSKYTKCYFKLPQTSVIMIASTNINKINSMLCLVPPKYQLMKTLWDGVAFKSITGVFPSQRAINGYLGIFIDVSKHKLLKNSRVVDGLRSLYAHGISLWC